MMTVRRSAERGHFDHGWLDTRHTFSFGAYVDEANMGFRSLRVINEDHVRPGAGFAEHGHSDMEIISYILSGRLGHRDSTGHESVVGAGDVQHMTAGRGIRHAEYNASRDEPVHFLQIWIEPRSAGLEPHYGQRHFSGSDRHNHLRLIASPDGSEDSLRIEQDAHLFAAMIDQGHTLEHEIAADRHVWIQVIDGLVQVNGTELRAGDGAAVSEESRVDLHAVADAHFLLFDLA
jgi:redox-sensitive bicupin YhaK (pirin superfamily)